MRCCVVGVGSVGARHLRNLALLGIGSSDIAAYRSSDTPVKYPIPGDVKFFFDFNDALHWSDVVVVANPTAFHVDVAMQAVKAGRHVYIEKPLSHTWDGVEELTKHARNLKVQIGSQFLFHPGIQQIRDWIRANKVLYGRSIFSEYLPMWHPGEDYRKSYAANKHLGGGVVLSQIHSIDILNYLFPCISSVFAVGGRLSSLEIDVEDTVIASLETRENVPLQLSMDMCCQKQMRTLELFSEEEGIFLDFNHSRACLVEEKGNISLPAVDRNQMFIDCMKNFLAAVEGDENVHVPIEKGMQSLRIALAIKESLNVRKELRVND